MWVIFLLAAMTIAVCALIIVYIANKVLIAMENDREKNRIVNKEINNEKE